MAWKSPINNLTTALIFALYLLLTGCANTSAVPGGPIAQIGLPNSSHASIKVNAGSLTEGRLQVFKLHGGAQAFATAISAELTQSGKRLESEVTEMRIDITGFRLRSTSAGFWLSAMAGIDRLDVMVTLHQGEKTLRSYSTGAKGLVAGIFKPSAGGRFQGLIELVAKRIVQKL